MLIVLGAAGAEGSRSHIWTLCVHVTARAAVDKQGRIGKTGEGEIQPDDVQGESTTAAPYGRAAGKLQGESRGAVATLRCKPDLDAAWEYSGLNVGFTSKREAKQQSHSAEQGPAEGTNASLSAFL